MTLNELLEDFHGLRNDVATAIADRFESVSDLAAASVERLTEIKGVGQSTAERLIERARGAAAQAADEPAAPTSDGRSATVLDRVASIAGATVGTGVGLLRSLQRRLSA